MSLLPVQIRYSIKWIQVKSGFTFRWLLLNLKIFNNLLVFKFLDKALDLYKLCNLGTEQKVDAGKLPFCMSELWITTQKRAFLWVPYKFF